MCSWDRGPTVSLKTVFMKTEETAVDQFGLGLLIGFSRKPNLVDFQSFHRFIEQFLPVLKTGTVLVFQYLTPNQTVITRLSQVPV
jgi:hypothetical protein